ncbi:hypothetical protein J2X47_003689 [Sphingomonas sp. BE270]|jgi:hypothetical protein|uniref:DUF6927 domain-containing protein n=2 Tax=root TaxID=1 RepID=A0ABU4PG45_9SPHN|nr:MULTISPECIES: hypothetical protein [Sphingomonas]MDR7259485.1 hypothetical protein [Sphingomonas sp. BE270]MDX5982996.1 hypothetical protein [Sphingomonas echinoides]
MGWLTMSRYHMGGHATAKAYLDAQFTYSRDVDGVVKGLKLLASSCPQNRTYYAAAQVTVDGVGGEVFAIVCKVIWNPKSKTGEHFGYKDMDESMGPCEDNCPAQILDLLTPTDKEHALDWRRRCRTNLERRARKIEDGDRIQLAAALTFTDGHVGDEFIVVRRGRRLSFRDPETSIGYAISRFMEREWTVVPVTKVHKTIFA